MSDDFFEFTVGGRRVSKDEFFKHLETEAVETAMGGAHEIASQVVCPVYKMPAKSVKRTSGSDGGFELTLCCKELKNAVAKALSAQDDAETSGLAD